MAYDESLELRIRAAVGKRAGVTAKQMFGGIAFLRDVKMFIGIVKNDLMVRVGPENHERLIQRPHARVMDFVGRPMVGYLYFASAGCRTVSQVRPWVEGSYDFVATVKRSAKKPARKSAAPKPRRPAH